MWNRECRVSVIIPLTGQGRCKSKQRCRGKGRRGRYEKYKLHRGSLYARDFVYLSSVFSVQSNVCRMDVLPVAQLQMSSFGVLVFKYTRHYVDTKGYIIHINIRFLLVIYYFGANTNQKDNL